jgi:hypothetical protein
MDSIKLAARCYHQGLLSKEAMAEVLRTRDRLIKEAINFRMLGAAAKKGAYRTGQGSAKKTDDATGFLGRIKQSLGKGSVEKPRKAPGPDGDEIKGLAWSQTVGNLVKLLGAGAALQGGAAGMQGLLRHRKDKELKGQIQDSYSKMMEMQPTLKEKDRSQVARHFGVLARYAPSLAADPMVAGSWVNNSVSMGIVDPQSIRQLSDTQTAIDRAHESRALVQPGQFGKGLALAQSAMG